MSEFTLLGWEWIFTAIAWVVAITAALKFAPELKTLSAPLKKLSVNNGWAIVIAGFVPVLFRLALLPVLPVPTPAIMEEFGYLLQADTFASGRLTNPPPAMADQLETFQQLVRPTYASFRPPGQGLFMALGQVLFHEPWAGICLTVFCFGAALCWMLQGWLPRGWAFWTALFATFWWAVFGFWMNSYWGGALAATGGCLVVGAYPRITSQDIRPLQQTIAAALLMTGLAILSVTRAYEGMLVALPVAVALLIWFFRDAALPRTQKLLRVGLPIAVGLCLMAGWSAYYNWRIVGDPFTAPYQLGRTRYNMAAPFLFQKANLTLHYKHEQMRKFYAEWEMNGFRAATTPTGYLRAGVYKLWEFWRIYIRPELTLPLLLTPWLIRRRNLRLPAAVLCTMLAGLLIETWAPPYYYAPLAGVLALFLAEGLRYTSSWRLAGKTFDSAGGYASAAACIATIILATGLIVLKLPVRDQLNYLWIGNDHTQDDRAAIVKALESLPGKHLVLVKYGAAHSEHYEWVFNHANIDGSKVVWAREMSPAKDQEIIQYYSGRRAWLIEPEVKPLRLVPIARDGSPISRLSALR